MFPFDLALRENLCASTNGLTMESPTFFLYQTVFKRTKLRLPFTGFERALLTEINVAPAQLHPNSWAFVRSSQFCATTLGILPPWMSSSIFSRLKARGMMALSSSLLWFLGGL